MPIGRTDKTSFVGNSFAKDPMDAYTKSFIDFSKNVLNESNIDIFEEPQKILRRPNTREALKEFFCENFMDENPADPFNADPGYIEDQHAMMEQQFENDAQAVFEHAVMADYNPVIGITFPVHKNILMKREGHTDDGVHSGDVGVLQNGLTVIQELLLQSLVSFLDLFSSILRIKRFNGVVISGALNEEVLQSIHGALPHHGLSRLGEQVNAGLGHNVTSALSKALGIIEDRIILITTAHGRSRFTITYNARHILFLLYRILYRKYLYIPYKQDFTILLLTTNWYKWEITDE